MLLVIIGKRIHTILYEDLCPDFWPCLSGGTKTLSIENMRTLGLHQDFSGFPHALKMVNQRTRH